MLRVSRFYPSVNARQLSLGDLLTCLRQMPRVQRMEAGEDKDGRSRIEAMAPEDLAAALATGQLDVPIHELVGAKKKGGKQKLDKAQKKAFERQLMSKFGGVG